MRRILIVHDHKELRHRLGQTLSTAGYQVVEAQSGTMALELAPSILPDLVLMTILLPDLSFFDLAKKLRALSGFASVPIILLTVIPPLGIADEPLARYINGFLDEKIAPDQLVEYVKRIL